MNSVRALADIGPDDLALVGGKGLGLGALLRAGAPVPDGFVVTTDAYRDTLRHNGIPDTLTEVGAPGGLHELGARLAEATLPVDLAGAITAAYAALGADVPVAVRSSATAEDLDGASFAGQQETVLNVVGIDAVLDAVRRCWASLWSGPAVAYRRRAGIGSAELAMAVVVQQLVPADAAGVLFTADPLTGARDRLVVDATWGLGEALVGGPVTPDHLVIDKATGAVLEQRIADKDKMSVCRDQGITLTAVPEHLRRAPALQANEIAQLVELARLVEAAAGAPRDIEWACRGGRVLLTQARAITALPPDLLGMQWSRQMLIERYPDPLTPFTWSAVNSTFFASLSATVRALGGQLPADVPMIRLIHGRAYVNVTAFQAGMQSLPLRPPVVSSGPPAEAPAAGTGAAGAPEQAPAGRPRFGPRTASAAVRLLRLLLGTADEWEGLLPGYSARTRDRAQKAWGTLSTEDLLAARAEQAADLSPLLDNHSRAIVAADLTLHLLGTITRRWLGDADGDLVLTLLSGLTGNLTVATNRVLWQLAQLDPSGPDFGDGLRDFLAQYGHRSPRYEFAHPTWGEDPEQVVELVRLLAGSPDPGIGEQARATAREAATRQARSSLRWPRRLVFSWALGLAQSYFRLRENQQFTIVLGVPTMRAMVLELGRRLTSAGALERPEDVFLLETDEVDTVARKVLGSAEAPVTATSATERTDPADLTDPTEVCRLVARRRAQLDAYRSFSAPVELAAQVPVRSDTTATPTSRPTPTAKTAAGPAGDTPDTPDSLVADTSQTGVPASEQVRRGIPASRGQARGTARIVRGPEDFARVRPGDILLAPATSPAWTPLFGVVAGLVTEFGGLLSHAGVVAREYGLPAVLGVTDLLAHVCDGDEVTLDGATGLVTIRATAP